MKIKNLIKSTVFLASLVATPMLASAAGGILDPLAPTTTGVSTLITNLTTIVNQIVPFLIALAVLAIIYGLVRFAFSAGDEGARQKGKDVMIWGVITLFVIVAIWGFVNFLLGIFFGGTGAIAPPTGPATAPTPFP